MRLFIAIDLDEDSRSAIASEQARLKAAAPESSLRWVRTEQLHMTLVFIGQVDDERGARMREAFGRPVDQAAFDLTFGGIGAFPPRGAPRALWIGTLDGRAELEALQRELAARAVQLGAVLEPRAFSPHLTIARWKSSKPSDRRRALAGARAEPLARVRIDHATLYRSELSSSGSTYTALAQANLNVGSLDNRVIW
jgi:RNA 2',3'-cyclic 3'-phosphodiesterase